MAFKGPVQMEVLTDLGVFLTRVEGRVDDQLLGQYQESIVGLPNYSSMLNTLFDGSFITENAVSPESIIKFSSSTPFDASVKRAYIVSDEKSGMLATLFGSTTSNSENFLVTHKLDVACEWLGISYDAVKASSVYADE